jgi:hypothetical protein
MSGAMRSAEEMRAIARSRSAVADEGRYERAVVLACRKMLAAARMGSTHALFRVCGEQLSLSEDELPECAKHVGLALAKSGYLVEVFEPNQVLIRW